MELEQSNQPPSTDPDESGAQLVQKKPTDKDAGTVIRLPQGRGGLREDSVADTVRELSEQGVRGHVGMALLIRLVHGVEQDLEKQQQEKKQAQAQADEWREKFYEKRQEFEVLREKINGLTKLKLMQNILLTAGGTVLGIAAKGFDKPLSLSNVGALALGIVLLLAGWLWTIIFKEDK